MGRRLVGGVLVGFGLVCASLAWAAFSLTRTVLDPDQSQAIAEAVYDDPQVQSYLKDAIIEAAEPLLPDSVPRVDIAAAADRALDDPEVEELMVGGLVRAHQRFLGEDPHPDEPIVVDGTALAAATRTELVNSDPELLATLPEVPSFAVTLPTDSIPDAGGLRATVVGAVAFLIAATVGLVAAAFVLTDDRARVLRRVGLWAIGAAAFWLVVGVVVPSLAHLLLPDEATVVASIWGVAAEGMVNPSVIAACAGVVALVLSIIWMIGSAIAARSRRRRGRRHGADGGTAASPPRTAPASGGGTPTPVTSRDPVAAYEAEGRRARSRAARAAAGGVAAGGAAVGGVAAGQPSGPVRARDLTRRRGGFRLCRPKPPRAKSTWVEGVGYVDDPDATRY